MLNLHVAQTHLTATDPEMARLIRQAAIELGVNGNPLLPNGGNDDVQTPPELARAIVAHFLPSGRVLEPCRGGGAFVKAIPGCDWCNLAAGRDFLAAKGRWDWIVSNPPYSQFRAFLQKAMQAADNIVFVSLVGAWFVRSRQQDMRQSGFALVELAELPIPPDWPQFGLEYPPAGHAAAGRGASPTRGCRRIDLFPLSTRCPFHFPRKKWGESAKRCSAMTASRNAVRAFPTSQASVSLCEPTR